MSMIERNTLESYKVPGKRNVLKVGAVAKVKGRRGEFEIERIDVFPTLKTVEVLTWWRCGGRAQFVTLQVEGPIAVTFTSISKG